MISGLSDFILELFCYSPSCRLSTYKQCTHKHEYMVSFFFAMDFWKANVAPEFLQQNPHAQKLVAQAQGAADQADKLRR